MYIFEIFLGFPCNSRQVKETLAMAAGGKSEDWPNCPQSSGLKVEFISELDYLNQLRAIDLHAKRPSRGLRS